MKAIPNASSELLKRLMKKFEKEPNVIISMDFDELKPFIERNLVVLFDDMEEINNFVLDDFPDYDRASKIVLIEGPGDMKLTCTEKILEIIPTEKTVLGLSIGNNFNATFILKL